jgi:hypothetical protein
MRIREEIKEIINLDYAQEGDAVNLRNLNNLAVRFPGSITVVFDDPQQYPVDIILNCYAYAFGFQFLQLFKENYLKIKKLTGKEGIPEGFVLFLIKNRHLQEIKTPIKNCLVLYFGDKEELKHAAILEKEGPDEDCRTVHSRWGTFRAKLTHKIWYVPDYYGTKIKYYHPLNLKEAENYLCEFLKTQGLVIRHI